MLFKEDTKINICLVYSNQENIPAAYLCLILRLLKGDNFSTLQQKLTVELLAFTKVDNYF